MDRQDPDRLSREAEAVVMAVSYVECDIPDGATLRQWRRSHSADRPPRRRAWRRLLRRVAVVG